ncbi:hypothetical protein FCULG_00002127 [Fusarium culmorum]|uniref:Uncharacterized protein n=1 Tax=Fusarium culmorum TaxID=5516 RepID=A0A2T4GJY8_FUSCU|nr:hypothetical protein FCULG_00002127 [Fusarium culmorum]
MDGTRSRLRSKSRSTTDGKPQNHTQQQRRPLSASPLVSYGRYLGFSPLVPTSTGTVRYLGRPSVTRYWMSTLLYRLSGLVKFLGGSDCRSRLFVVYQFIRNEDVEEEKTRQAGRYPESKGGITYYQAPMGLDSCQVKGSPQSSVGGVHREM